MIRGRCASQFSGMGAKRAEEKKIGRETDKDFFSQAKSTKRNVGEVSKGAAVWNWLLTDSGQKFLVVNLLVIQVLTLAIMLLKEQIRQWLY